MDPGRKAMTNLDSILKSRDITSMTKLRLVKAIAFPVWSRELDHKESWAPKNGYFWTVLLEKTLDSPLDCKEIQPVNPKGNQAWILIRRTDAEAEAPVLWPPDAKNWLIGKRPWCWERLKAGEEGNNRVWDGWMASLTQWTWVWVNSGSWWWTGKPGLLQSIGLWRVRHSWATELNWAEWIWQNPLMSIGNTWPSENRWDHVTPLSDAMQWLPSSCQGKPKTI